MNNISTKENKENKTRIRSLLSVLILKQPKILSITDYDDNGDMKFAVSLIDLISLENYYNYTKEFLSNYTVDFIGELLIRENIELFMSKLTTEKNYIESVNKSLHKRFGMKVEKGIVTFSFHISLIQEILTEDFKSHQAIKDQKNEQ